MIKTGPFSESLGRFYFKQIIAATEYIHNLNIAHLDLKLENMLLTVSDEVKLCDFGFARECEDGEYISDKKGTYGYMAPEV